MSTITVTDWTSEAVRLDACRERVLDADHAVQRRVNGGWTVGDMLDLHEDITRAEQLAEVTE
ncbi:hypothetical protein FH969_04815 [Miniimonas arenae]|uniref:Uncharacterized protein n=1 Tax=Miniimonas arenae TaxID=676201 RepID=A0A5C5BCQ5_9MICO|nr:hypothetical protein [Miniimonas arenae]TNU76110.1 hypothetical protein FH969_04815 [Miniimonas arenae]